MQEKTLDSNTVSVGDATYNYYEIANPGKPKLLMLHGMMVESHCFEKVAAELKNDFHIFLLDLKGHGKSSDGASYDAAYSNEVICNDLKAIHQQIIGEPCHLAGYSLGGQYSLLLAGSHPECLKTVTLIDSGPDVSFKGMLAILMAIFKTPKFFKNADHVRKFYGNSVFGLGDYMLKHCLRELDGGRYAIRYDKKNVAPGTFAKAKVRTLAIWDACAKLTTPVRVLRAEKSFVLNDKICHRMQTNPKIEVVLMPGMEHNLVFAEPKAVAEQLREFTGRHA